MTEEDADKNELLMRKEDEENRLKQQRENEDESESIIHKLSDSSQISDFIENRKMPFFMKSYLAFLFLLVVLIIAIVSFEFAGKTQVLENIQHYHEFFIDFNIQKSEYQNLADSYMRLIVLATFGQDIYKESTVRAYMSLTAKTIDQIQSNLL